MDFHVTSPESQKSPQQEMAPNFCTFQQMQQTPSRKPRTPKKNQKTILRQGSVDAIFVGGIQIRRLQNLYAAR